MKPFRLFTLFLTLQLLFHLVASSLSPIEASEKFCFLSECVTKGASPILATLYAFGWFIHGIVFLWILSSNRPIATITYGLSGGVLVLVFGNLSGYQFELLIIFMVSGILSLIYYLTLPYQKTKEGHSLWFVLSCCTYVLSFPLAMALRVLLNIEGEISETWELTSITMSILSVIAFTGMLAAIFAKRHSDYSEETDELPTTRKKKSTEKPVKEYVVSIFYFGSLFFSTDYIKDMDPNSIFLPLFLFWGIIYPLVRKRSKLVRTIVFTFYVISFLFAFDALIYQITEMIMSNDEFVIIAADYIIILIYLSMYPLFKTLPEYYFLSKSKKKSFSMVYKNGLTNELLILLFILVKMNLSHYMLY